MPLRSGKPVTCIYNINMYYYIFCQGDILLTSEGNIPFGSTPPIDIKPWQLVTTLCNGNNTCKIIRLDTPVSGNSHFKMVPLRKSAEILSPQTYQFAGKCAELIYWDRNTKYCGVCGSPLKWQTPISKQCPECQKEWWPTLAIATIVRVERGDEILMVHANSFRGNFYGLVAGFVETGETLEECVAREVWEETHIRIKDIRYYGSQPWPYPCGLMVGFTAQYESGTLLLQKEELGGGGWFTFNNLPELPAQGSIAREMIDDWISEQNNREQ